MTEDLAEIFKVGLNFVPYNAELGLRFAALSENGCVLSLPYRSCLIGDPETGALHVGAIDAFIDGTFGFSVFRRAGGERGYATLDLRIDHLDSSTAGRELFCVGDCHKVTPDFAFVRGCAYHDDPAEPIATAIGIFMFADSIPSNGRPGRNA